MAKAATTLIVALLCSPAFAQTSTSVPESCSAPSPNMRLTDVLIETDSASSLLVQLSNGNAEDAMRDLRATLLGDIMELNLNLIARACKPDPASIARIYQTLRLIAAVNHNNPIPEVTDNKEARKVLEQAIADNPKQYEQLLERSKKWDHGIK